MAKYLTKSQVVADYVQHYLNKVSVDDRETTWLLMLDFMLKDKRISANQHSTWTFPTKQVKEYDTQKELLTKNQRYDNNNDFDPNVDS